MTVTALSPDQAQLALELGWDQPAPRDVDWLQCLLDDEFEQLDPTARADLRARLSGGELTGHCDECGNLILRRYRPDDGRCRVCAAPLPHELQGRPTRRSASAEAKTAELVDPAWCAAEALTFGRPVVIDQENEDWDDRADRIRLEQAQQEAEHDRQQAERDRQQAERDRRRRQAEEVADAAEARRRERERRRKQMAELIPPVSTDKLTQLKRQAHVRIEERLRQNRRRRRLLRGGDA